MQFGLNIPKYLNQGKLTDKQIQANTNKIKREIEKQLDIKRVQANIPTMEKAMKQLEKAVVKHNQLVYKKLNYVSNKYSFILYNIILFFSFHFVCTCRTGITFLYG